MRFQKGFHQRDIHRGIDGKHVANYAQWESKEAFLSMLKDPAA